MHKPRKPAKPTKKPGKPTASQATAALSALIRKGLEAQGHEVPAKAHTKLKTPITKGTRSYFGVLPGVPGGHWFAMAHHAETGTIVATYEQEQKLLLSAKHCHTTKSFLTMGH